MQTAGNTSAAHAGEARAVAQALHGQVADGSLRRCRAAGFKRDGHHRLGAGVGVRLAAAAAARNQTVADERDALLAELFLILGASVF